MKFIKFIAAAAVATAFAAPASADTMGVANLTVRALFIQNTDDFSVITSGITLSPSQSRQGGAGANFNGIQDSGNASFNGPPTLANPLGEVDVSYRCVGPDCGSLAGVYGGPVENNTTFHMAAPSGSFAVGDMYIGGSAVGATGANGFTRADSSVANSSNEGGSSATIQNTASATTVFTVAQDVDARFGINYDAYVAAFVGAGIPAGTVANSSGGNTFALTLRRSVTGVANTSVTLINWSPEELNGQVSSSHFSENSVIASTGLLFSDSVKLLSGYTYSLVIGQSSNSTASEIPEPGTMVLAALGLFAAGVASRRRSK